MLIAPKRLQLYDSKLDARISTVTADMNPYNFWKMDTDGVTPEIFKITWHMYTLSLSFLPRDAL